MRIVVKCDDAAALISPGSSASYYHPAKVQAFWEKNGAGKSTLPAPVPETANVPCVTDRRAGNRWQPVRLPPNRPDRYRMARC